LNSISQNKLQSSTMKPKSASIFDQYIQTIMIYSAIGLTSTCLLFSNIKVHLIFFLMKLLQNLTEIQKLYQRIAVYKEIVDNITFHILFVPSVLIRSLDVLISMTNPNSHIRFHELMKLIRRTECRLCSE
jgi:hypothetical protein